MNHKPWLGAVLVMCGALITGCDMDADTTMENGAIVLKGKHVVLSPDQQHEASIDASGNLTIDDKTVSVTPAQQALLMAYYMNVVDVHNTGINMAKAGGKMAIQAIAHASSGNDDKTKDATEQLVDLSMTICKDTAGIKTVQDQLAAQLPAFKPYAGIVSSASVDSCVNEAKEDSKDGAKS